MVTILVDTSVLIAAAVREHPHHEPSFSLVQRIQAGKLRGFICSHSIAECYAVLTGLPRVPDFPPKGVRELIQRMILDLFDLVDLSSKDYRTAVDLVVERGLKSGAIFDALLVQAAVKRKIPSVVTWNLKHFERFASSKLKMQTPIDWAEN